LQTLSIYNAVANNGEMVKPLFVREIKEWNKTIKKFDKQVICPKIASDATLKKVRAVLENVVRKGTGKALYSPNFSMAGKTGTAQVDYYKGEGKLYYASSFVGYFPADNPKYSCIVVVHKPSTAKGYYGADVAGPVFKRIAQKIFTDSPSMNEVRNLKQRNPLQDKNFERYDAQVVSGRKTIPNLKGMAGMDAVALLENLGMKVRVIGVGKVRKQSLNPGESIQKNTTITLELS
ncbi:MAG TPA: penicillin-binding transpeptidase domain-containing protein, partial [Flavobacterium sp.]|nr:penicillin-binding transpeptidase domain-containing protein [Flavobacterium sp.]